MIPWEEFASAKAKKARIAVFRPNGVSSEAMEKATEAFFNKAFDAQTLGKPIPYDFTMTENDVRIVREPGFVHYLNVVGYFCSKVYRKIVQNASSNQIELPTFPSRPQGGTADLFRKMGIEATELFAPGDYDLDPRLEPVAEWTSVKEIRKTREMSIVMRQFFHWMKEHDYRLKMDVNSSGQVSTSIDGRFWGIKTKIALLRFFWKQRKIQNYRIGWENFNITLPNPFRAMVKNFFPEYIPQGALMTILLVNEVANELHGLLKGAIKEGHPKKAILTPKQLIELTDTLFLVDQDMQEKDGRSNFHHLFACEKAFL